MSDKRLNVLWVENDENVIASYKMEAEIFGLDLINYTCWDDARVALTNEFSSWDAIILDGKCKFHRDSADNAVRFLSEVFADLREIFADKRKTINWYVLSGELGEADSDLISESRLAWDKDWSKTHYSKTVDRIELYKRIVEQNRRGSNVTQLKTVFYKELFTAIESRDLGEDVERCMIDLLEPLHFPDSVADKQDYNNRLFKARLVLEYIFRSMIKWGILPSTYRTTTPGSDKINETFCISFLKGKPNPKSNTIYDNEGVPIPPKILADNLFYINFATGSRVHTSETHSPTEMNLADYLESVNGSTCLISSYALQLTDLILWYDEYLKTHDDVKENASHWTVIE